MSEQDLDQCLVDFVSTNRVPMRRAETAAELELLATHGAQWPKCSRNQWTKAIGRLLDSGKLAIDDVELICLPPPAEDVSEPQVEQLELF